MEAGVYLITSPSGNCYVGSASRGFGRRWATHKSHLRAGTHHSSALQSAWNKYGESGMKFSKLLICSPEMVLFYEQRAIDFYDPKYNMLRVAGSSVGWKHTDETRKLMSLRRTGAKQTSERIAARVAKVKGKKRSAEAIEASASARRGLPMPEHVKEKLRVANTGKKYGPMSEDHKRKISDANKGRKPSEFAISELKKMLTGKKQDREMIASRIAKSIETRKKNAEKGICYKRHSAEANAKKSEQMKLRWATKRASV